MNDIQLKSLMGHQCAGCGGEFIAGMLPDCAKTTWYEKDGETVFYELRCEACSEQHAIDLWTDDELPLPPKIVHVRQGRPS
jgi:hypothetical protein